MLGDPSCDNSSLHGSSARYSRRNDEAGARTRAEYSAVSTFMCRPFPGANRSSTIQWPTEQEGCRNAARITGALRTRARTSVSASFKIERARRSIAATALAISAVGGSSSRYARVAAEMETTAVSGLGILETMQRRDIACVSVSASHEPSPIAAAGDLASAAIAGMRINFETAAASSTVSRNMANRLGTRPATASKSWSRSTAWVFASVGDRFARRARSRSGAGGSGRALANRALNPS
mmetsp:Transcript_4461/g.9515  ORF Transcript_4461/g.9515 Transcript_4461/m.9515 type:complete len:238 (-) Transcript_4461:1710-2423(-)